MSWIYLVTAGLFEIGWPVGLKWAQEPGKPVFGVALAVVAMTVSGALIFLAQKEIALGTAYAVWTGIGAAGTFLVGLWLFGDPGNFGRYLGVVLIIAGVVTLKLAH
jgi:quaternary ammonium compound-resistance protein SugE